MAERKKGSGGARKGAGLKGGETLRWRTEEERKAACDSFCLHISQGLSVKSWPDADERTLKKYVKEHPKDFDKERMAQAYRKGILFWERMGIAGASGKLKGFNSGAWIFNMKNRVGWVDKIDHQVSGEIKINIDRDDARLSRRE